MLPRHTRNLLPKKALSSFRVRRNCFLSMKILFSDGKTLSTLLPPAADDIFSGWGTHALQKTMFPRPLLLFGTIGE